MVALDVSGKRALAAVQLDARALLLILENEDADAADAADAADDGAADE